LEELRQRVANLLKLATLEKENDALRRRLTTEGQFGQIDRANGGDAAHFEMADRVRPTDSTVFDFGRKWNRKRRLGAGDPRAIAASRETVRGGKLRPRLPETLIESELFGYERGAFTGAAQQKKGKF